MLYVSQLVKALSQVGGQGFSSILDVCIWCVYI